MNSPAQPEIIEGREALGQALLEVVASSEFELRLASQCLDGRLFRQAALLEALRRRLLEQRRLSVRVLLSDPVLALREAEPLIELFRRLSSQVSIRSPSREADQFSRDLLIADERSYALRERPDQLKHNYASNDPPAARALARDFDSAWDQARPASELRRLGI